MPKKERNLVMFNGAGNSEITSIFVGSALIPSLFTITEFVVKNCRECQSINSSTVRINGGELSVEEDWKGLALDVTHYGCQKYLTIVDCGPS